MRWPRRRRTSFGTHVGDEKARADPSTAKAIRPPIPAIPRTEPIQCCAVQPGMDDIEREAIRDEGLDPDDPAVIAAIDVVRWELSMRQPGFVEADTRPPSRP
jgi:hypothetical protein